MQILELVGGPGSKLLLVNRSFAERVYYPFRGRRGAAGSDRTPGWSPGIGQLPFPLRPPHRPSPPPQRPIHRPSSGLDRFHCPVHGSLPRIEDLSTIYEIRGQGLVWVSRAYPSPGGLRSPAVSYHDRFEQISRVFAFPNDQFSLSTF